MKLGFDFNFDDLYEYNGLQKLDEEFQKYSTNFENADLLERARILEDFLVELFDVKKENDELKKHHADLQKIYVARREFVQREVAKKFSDAPADIDGSRILQDLEISYKDIEDLEKQLATKILAQENLDVLTKYTCFALYSDVGRNLHKNGALFILPKKIDHQNLVSPCQEKAKRDGFNLTDQGFDLNRSLAEAHYCIFCHKQKKDSCRSGLFSPAATSNANLSTVVTPSHDGVKKDPLGVELHGCPLDEKISEMNLLKSEGFSLAALAVAAIDNPMIAGTGHRICNDCMKSCIYQKQDAVDIPQIETRVLKDVLSLPYGFEIYSLLTRWNPLAKQKIPQKNSGKKILICGLGPAGYTLAHYLLNDGHEVVAIDGLKIEPLNPEISGIDEFGNRQKFKPIKYLDEIYEPLSSRLIQGFGGVAEYGITVRWNKNYLKIIRLLLERRKNFRMFGGIRFGSSINEEIAFQDYGFDHVALCIGAGRPNIIDLKNNFAKGVRMASDFLMSLQLTGAFKEDLFTNLQVRMPAIVIGGGLTAVDTACEVQAYYQVQIKKFAKKFAEIGQEKIWPLLNEEEKNIAEEFLRDAQNPQKILPVKILYRKKIQDSPAYRMNHQELNKAFEEGVEFIENITPLEVEIDQFNHVRNLKCADEKSFECKSLFVAAGTSPNISPVLEDGLDLPLFGKYFKPLTQGSVITKIDEISKKAVSFFGDLHPDFEGNVVKAMASAKKGYREITEVLCFDPVMRRGDNVKLEGNASSKSAAVTWPQNKGATFASSQNNCATVTQSQNNGKTVTQSQNSRATVIQSQNNSKTVIPSQNNHTTVTPSHDGVKLFSSEEFMNKINSDFQVRIEKIERLSDHVVELFIKAPLLAKQTQVGQIFRLQNYHALAPKSGNQILAMEGVPVTALSIDRHNGVISGIVVETGGSTSLIKNFKIGEPCIFMGPSGKPTEIPKNETVVLIGGGRGNQPLTALAESFTANGCKVIFFAGYRKNNFVVREERMKNSCAELLISIEDEKPENNRFKGSVIDSIKNYFSKNSLKLDRIFTIGNDQMMHEIARLRHENIVPEFAEAKFAITSLNAPMQCMLKGVCSQCLQKRVNQKGEVEYFYSCADQDQNMDNFDFAHLKNRCEQNSLMEKVSKLWIRRC